MRLSLRITNHSLARGGFCPRPELAAMVRAGVAQAGGMFWLSRSRLSGS